MSWQYGERRSSSKIARLYIGGIVGRHHDHRHIDRLVAAGRAVGTRGRQANTVQQQHQTTRLGLHESRVHFWMVSHRRLGMALDGRRRSRHRLEADGRMDLQRLALYRTAEAARLGLGHNWNDVGKTGRSTCGRAPHFPDSIAPSSAKLRRFCPARQLLGLLSTRRRLLVTRTDYAANGGDAWTEINNTILDRSPTRIDNRPNAFRNQGQQPRASCTQAARSERGISPTEPATPISLGEKYLRPESLFRWLGRRR